MPTLYVVATPIGNLEDVSLRALRVLREVKLIAAEDTRRTRKLLTAYDIKTPLTSYHERNKLSKMDYVIAALAEGDVALVADAGMPGIADPGHELIVTANERGITVIPVPGPSAVITALAVSGLDTTRFTYIGFLPHRAGERRRLLESVASEPGTLVALETPHRLTAALGDIRQVLGERRLAVCRELTKLHEEVFRGTVSRAVEHFNEPRGEFTLVIEGRGEPEKPQLNENIETELEALRREGVPAREAISRLAGETGITRRELYRAWLKAGR
jgi:16S rRNA (cytidine1402-2'-O)-methyltransferase